MYFYARMYSFLSAFLSVCIFIISTPAHPNAPLSSSVHTNTSSFGWGFRFPYVNPFDLVINQFEPLVRSLSDAGPAAAGQPSHIQCSPKTDQVEGSPTLFCIYQTKKQKVLTWNNFRTKNLAWSLFCCILIWADEDCFRSWLFGSFGHSPSFGNITPVRQ